MGYGRRNNDFGKPTIETFWPDDTNDRFYVEGTIRMPALLEKIYEKWPDCDLNSISITSEYIHTDCLTYDLYDAGDYTEFLVITNYAAEDEDVTD